MNTFRIIPLSMEYASQIRETGKDDYDHDVIEQVAKGVGPCRVSLKPFQVGKDVRLLFSHSPFFVDNVFNQPGPVFIHKNVVEEYQDVHHFPKEIKADKINFPLTLIGYSQSQKMVFSKLVGENDVDEMINNIFREHPEVAYLHARNAEAACFICKIERWEKDGKA